jgi:hypothetical protein
MMRIKIEKHVTVSLDEGLTVTVLPPGVHDVPEWVGKMAKKHFGAVEVKGKKG